MMSSPAPGEELDQVAARGGHALIGAHQHPQGAGGGDLLALHEVGGDVVGDLPGQQVDGAHVGLLHPQILDDGEAARLTHGPAHVQLAGGLLHKLHVGSLHIAPHVARLIGHGQDGAQGAAALDLQGEGGAVDLHGVPHQGGGHKGSPQCGSGHGQKGVDIPGPLHQVPAGDGGGLDQAVRCNGSYDFVAHDIFSLYVCDGKEKEEDLRPGWSCGGPSGL